jgi:alkylated DNA repair dioxygenase AlkB
VSAPVTYVPDFVSPAFGATAFERLRTELAWERRETAPRSEYWTNLFDRPYTYGNGVGQRTYQAQVSHPIIDEIRDSMFEDGTVLEGCFLNLYNDGTDALGWHADDDKKIDHAKPIAVLTLGQGRAIQFKSQERGSHPQELFLETGSLLLMHAGMQQTHFHRIPRVDVEIGPRISLTYRGLIHA